METCRGLAPGPGSCPDMTSHPIPSCLNTILIGKDRTISSRVDPISSGGRDDLIHRSLDSDRICSRKNAQELERAYAVLSRMKLEFGEVVDQVIQLIATPRPSSPLLRACTAFADATDEPDRKLNTVVREGGAVST